MLVADLTEEQKASVRRKLDAMVRERANTAAVAMLTAPVNIGFGTK
jgi:hypothetical protein